MSRMSFESSQTNDVDDDDDNDKYVFFYQVPLLAKPFVSLEQI